MILQPFQRLNRSALNDDLFEKGWFFYAVEIVLQTFATKCAGPLDHSTSHQEGEELVMICFLDFGLGFSISPSIFYAMCTQ